MANSRNYLFSSESVSEGHPDKVCDRISDAVVDLYMAADPHSRVAIETLVTTNRIVMAGEVRGPESVTPALIEDAADLEHCELLTGEQRQDPHPGAFARGAQDFDRCFAPRLVAVLDLQVLAEPALDLAGVS